MEEMVYSNGDIGTVPKIPECGCQMGVLQQVLAPWLDNNHQAEIKRIEDAFWTERSRSLQAEAQVTRLQRQNRRLIHLLVQARMDIADLRGDRVINIADINMSSDDEETETEEE